MRASDKVKVGIVTALCLMGLLIILKNVLGIPAEILSRDMIIYIIVYFGFITAVNFTEEVTGEPAARPRTYDNPWVWSALVVVITLAIIAVYAFL
ncbi:MAG: hypothetical protein LUQ49_00895 [Methanomicrobiales archaeon]|nr:hypothetical protein [Methanomicrobiales archaeon]